MEVVMKAYDAAVKAVNTLVGRVHEHTPEWAWQSLGLAANITGKLVIAVAVGKTLSFVWRHALRPRANLYRRYQVGSTKPWAVITGGSDGLGRGFALVLAEMGFNIHLISRTETKLQAVKKAILEKYDVKVRYTVSDLSHLSVSEAAKMFDKETAELDVALVINNAGMAPGIKALHDMHKEHRLDKVTETIALNVTAFTGIHIAAARRLAARHGRGGIVDVSSASAHLGLPHVAVYAASKAYNNVLAISGYFEGKSAGIDVLSFTPLFIQTNMVPFKSIILTTPRKAALAALDNLGRTHWTVGTAWHEIQFNFVIYIGAPLFRIFTTCRDTLGLGARKKPAKAEE